jgi:hypothetical protein
MLTEHATPSTGDRAAPDAFVFWISRTPGGVYPALTLSLFILLYGWFLEKHLNAASALPALAALGAMFARAGSDRRAYFKALPAALIIAALAFTALPVGNPTWAPLSTRPSASGRCSSTTSVHRRPRLLLAVLDGYQPLGDALGGPADPSNENVMLVQSDRMLLLRGSVRRTTPPTPGPTAPSTPYLFIDPTKTGVRDRIFESMRLEATRLGRLREGERHVTMLHDGISPSFYPTGCSTSRPASTWRSITTTPARCSSPAGSRPATPTNSPRFCPRGRQAMEARDHRRGMSQDGEMDQVRRDYMELPRASSRACTTSP